ncbi:hypothetical protein GE061_005797 [Apolygus lucorum]|uniref:Uncharacterized protein n=1 Tax=Apolygus lucorum TaxID=248454 RepID=A0A6A4ISS0_APOLU|nr:hypothetical protein GE061_005797 [Apolygus lucorum]
MLNLTDTPVQSSADDMMAATTWLVGRVLLRNSSNHDGTTGRNLVCDGIPFGFLDSWSSNDGFERYYRIDHIVKWVFSNSLVSIEFDEIDFDYDLP